MLYPTQKSEAHQTPPEQSRPLRAVDGYLYLGMPEEALAALGDVPQEDHFDAPVMRAHIRVLLHLGKWDEANGLAEQGSELHPEENEFVVQRAFALHQLNKGGEAVQVIEGAPAWIRRTGIIHYNLACYEAQLGDLGIARECIRAAIRINSAFRKSAQYDPDLQKLWN